MPYITKYTVLIENIEDISDNCDVLKHLGGSDSGFTWSSQEMDMRSLSLKYPGKLFTVNSQGESINDKNTKKYYRGDIISNDLIFNNYQYEYLA